MSRPRKNRLISRNYWNAIKSTKNALYLSYGEIASWMALSPDNLRTMCNNGMNPTAKEWLAFKRGLRLFLRKPDGLFMVLADPKSVRTCNCGEYFVPTGSNNNHCPKCKLRR